MRKLYRSKREKILGGVCGGLGLYWDVDPTIIRLLALFIGCLTAFLPLAIAYLVAWVLIPTVSPEPRAPIFRRLYRSRTDRKIGGICGGIAQRLDLDSTFVRLAAIVLGLCTGGLAFFLTYLSGMFLIPQEESTTYQR